jgi:hypothetical protein
VEGGDGELVPVGHHGCPRRTRIKQDPLPVSWWRPNSTTISNGDLLCSFSHSSQGPSKKAWPWHAALPIHTRLGLFEMCDCHIHHSMGVVDATHLLVESCDHLLQFCGALFL